MTLRKRNQLSGTVEARRATVPPSNSSSSVSATSPTNSAEGPPPKCRRLPALSPSRAITCSPSSPRQRGYRKEANATATKKLFELAGMG